MENTIPKIVVGLSTVLEICWGVDENDQEKNYAKKQADLRVEVGGSSYNILQAMIKQGCNPDFVQFAGGSESDYFGYLLKNILVVDGIRTTTIPCFSDTRVSSINRLKQSNGKVLENVYENKYSINSNLFEEHYETLKSALSGFDWKILSGIKDSNEENRLLTDNFSKDSNNVLIPKIDLVKANHWKKIVSIADIIFLNRIEFESSGMSIKEYHELGLPFLVITNSDKGGEFSFNGKHEKYEAFNYGFSEIYETGAGDWFAASTCISLIRKNILKVRESGFENIKEAIGYASRIAGIKIGTPGASNGPSSI